MAGELGQVVELPQVQIRLHRVLKTGDEGREVGYRVKRACFLTKREQYLLLPRRTAEVTVRISVARADVLKCLPARKMTPAGREKHAREGVRVTGAQVIRIKVIEDRVIDVDRNTVESVDNVAEAVESYPGVKVDWNAEELVNCGSGDGDSLREGVAPLGRGVDLVVSIARDLDPEVAWDREE